jgi:LCP family protein required for cell wall assembly
MSAREGDKDARPSAISKHRYRRTWPQRCSIGLSTLTSVACLTAASGVWYTNHQLGKLQRVRITHLSAEETLIASEATAATQPGDTPTTTEVPLPVVDIKAQNYLIVGSDNRSCIDPNSPYYPGLYDGTDTGTNSDTIMLIRADPSAKQAAILSFPRDLYVRLADSNYRGKINSVFQNDNPSRLVKTIELNFQLKVDHYINVDFCAFKETVDAVGGVAVPFATPVRDLHTGFELLTSGCHTFSGDEALAYARSRYFEALLNKRWVMDETSDYGRIARQQDFLKRTIAKAIDKGITRPTVAQKLLNAIISRVKVDVDLTAADMLNLAAKLRGFDPATIRSYRIEGSDDGNSIFFDANSATNKGILRVFRGQARLKDAPDPASLTETDTTARSNLGSSSTTALTTTTTTPAASTTSTFGSGSVATTSTTAVIEVKENTEGFAPAKDLTCR